MSEENEDVESLDTSATEATLDEATSETSEVAAAESSPANSDKPSLLSVVRGVTGAADTASPAGQDSDSPPAAASTERDDEAFSDVPFNRHPRFQQLISQRNELRPDAQRYRHLQTFLTENAISQEEAANALTVAALVKSDPAKAWEELKPIVQDLCTRLGLIVPADLRQQVASGAITQEVAQVIAKERARAAQLEGRMTHEQAVAERKRQNEEQQAALAQARTLRDAVVEWEQSMREKDPDFSKKHEALTRHVLFLQHRDGKPKDAEGVRKQLGEALKATNAELAARRPARPAVTPVTGGRVARNAQQAPTSMLDVVRAARAG